MGLVPECDNCDKIYENGYQGFFKKNITKGRGLKVKDFTIEIDIRPRHLCAKCFKIIVKEALK